MANRFWVLGGTDTIWESTAGATTNWATTSGGAAGASVPLITDAAIFDAASPNACTTGTGNVCVSLTTTNWTGTFTMTGSPVIGGSITFGVNTVFTGAGYLIPNTTGTLTFGGCGSRPNLNLRGSTTKTLADNWNVVNLDIGITTENPTINGNTIDISGSLTPRITSGVIAGTTTLKMSGTGTFSMPNITTGNLKNNLTFNSAGTITVSGTIEYSTGTITYTAGTMVTTGSTLTIGTSSPTTPTYNTSGMTWNNVALLGTLTYTITSNLNVGGILSLGTVTSVVTINGLFNINVASLTMNFTGTASIVMNGTGTWSGTGIVKNNLTFNSAGTITVSGTVSKEANTLTYTAGTMSMGTSILSLTAATTLATNGMTWYNIWIRTISCTITLSNACQSTILEIGTSLTATFNTSALSITNLTMIATGTLAGSSAVTVTGGTVSGTELILNNSGGLTFAGSLTWTVTTFTRTAGTVTATGSTLTIAGSRTFAGATTWNNWDITGTATLTLNALQTLAGELDLQATTTFAGTNSWTANILNLSVAGLTHTLVSANTYTISASGQFIAAGTTGSHIALVASTAGTRAILTVTSGVSEGIDFLDRKSTRLNS